MTVYETADCWLTLQKRVNKEACCRLRRIHIYGARPFVFCEGSWVVLGFDFCLLFPEVQNHSQVVVVFLTLKIFCQNSFQNFQHFSEKAKPRAIIKPAKTVA